MLTRVASLRRGSLGIVLAAGDFCPSREDVAGQTVGSSDGVSKRLSLNRDYTGQHRSRYFEFDYWSMLRASFRIDYAFVCSVFSLIEVPDLV